MIYFSNNNNYKPKTTKNMSKNKTLYKYEFANKLGVSLKTFGRWIEPYRDDLEKLGVKRKGQLLTPGAVKFLDHPTFRVIKSI